MINVVALLSKVRLHRSAVQTPFKSSLAARRNGAWEGFCVVCAVLLIAGCWRVCVICACWGEGKKEKKNTKYGREQRNRNEKETKEKANESRCDPTLGLGKRCTGESEGSGMRRWGSGWGVFAWGGKRGGLAMP